MLASDTQRQQSLSGYEGTRRYVLVNDHMHKRAEMVVRVTGDPDGTKHFESFRRQDGKPLKSMSCARCWSRKKKRPARKHVSKRA